MDPPTLMNHGSYNLSEIWPFELNGDGAGVSNSSGIGLELRTGSHFGEIWGQITGSKDLSVNEHNLHMLMEQRGKNGGGPRKRRDGAPAAASEDESTSCVNGNGTDDSEGKRIKAPGSQDENTEAKAEVEQKPQPSEPPKQDYIHVRARRGQATDSHSLAERARREKISERMKILQDLVPGCNKVIGKAMVLDEIINYIQSLQRQVEFLSMKLEAVNSRSTGIEGFPSKDYGQQTFESSGMPFGAQAGTEYGRDTSPEWLHMQVGSGFERRT